MNVPNHLGIIPDGNRRFAKRLMLEPWKGHEVGAEKFKDITKWCIELGIKKVTFWGLSLDNLNRPKQEVDFLMDIFEKGFNELPNHEYIKNNHIRVRCIGNIHLLPERVQKSIKYVEGSTKNNEGLQVNVALAYGGRDELVTAVKRISEKIKSGEISGDEIDDKTIMNSLDLLDDIDYVIRTGGEHRTSGFFIWQTNYAEYCFIDKLYPDLKKEDFTKAIESYSERQRRFGK